MTAERDERPKSARLERQRQVARVRVVELRAGALLQKVGIDRIRPQQRDAVFPGFALALEPLELTRELDRLVNQVLLSLEAMIARMRVGPEIADDQRRPDIQAEGAQNRADAGAADHATNHDGNMRGRR